MRWRGRERSENVEDRRGGPGVGMAVGGGGLGMLLLVLIAMFLGADPRDLMQVAQNVPAAGQGGGVAAPVDDDAREFIEVVLRDTEKVWQRLFREGTDGEYRNPLLVIFNGSVTTGCGMASSAVGPFYCPADQKIYIDPTFFDELERRHRAPGDFAQAYVIAHEVAHHVQKQLGFSELVDQARRRGEREANRASVRLELQADFLAGVWAHHAHKEYNILEEGDVDEAINAANQIGADTLQRQAHGYVVPERFTHGSSKQRVHWFRAGLMSGNLSDCRQLFELGYEQL